MVTYLHISSVSFNKFSLPCVDVKKKKKINKIPSFFQITEAKFFLFFFSPLSDLQKMSQLQFILAFCKGLGAEQFFIRNTVL